MSTTRKIVSVSMLIVLLAGIAAVIVPSIQRYRLRSKTIEATMNVRRLYDASVSYFDSASQPSFPASAGPTPFLSELGPDQREPNPSLWETPTWKALEFRVVEPSYYAYQYESAGHGYDARAVASAFGDVNGDGELEAFARHVTVEPGNEIRGGAGLFQYDSGTDRRSFLPESTGEDHPPFPVRTNTGSVAESEFQTQRGVQSFEVRGGAGL